MLTTFGVFWGAEGAGAVWPGSDAAIPVLLVFVLVVSLGAVAVLRRVVASGPVAADVIEVG
jgi:uncharacterized membrane protein